MNKYEYALTNGHKISWYTCKAKNENEAHQIANDHAQKVNEKLYSDVFIIKSLKK